MDGVLANFVKGAFVHYGFSMPVTEVPWDFVTAMSFDGVNDPEFWRPLDTRFWASLERCRDGFELLAGVERLITSKRIGLLTAPMPYDGIFDGKRRWVEAHLPDYSRRFFTGVDKHLLASPSKILVDDNDTNCERFVAEGGLAVLVPRSWNKRKKEISPEGAFDVPSLLAEIASMVG
jgi:hypothetical protein